MPEKYHKVVINRSLPGNIEYIFFLEVFFWKEFVNMDLPWSATTY